MIDEEKQFLVSYLLICSGVGAIFGAHGLPILNIGEFFHYPLYFFGVSSLIIGTIIGYRNK